MNSPRPSDREQIREFHFAIETWRRLDEHGTWWWFAQARLGVGLDGEMHFGPIWQSRVSRQRATSYVLAENVQWLHEYDPTTPLDGKL